MLIMLCHIAVKEGVIFLNSEFDFFFLTIFTYKLLQAFPQKHL